jgi:transposase, IS30 family
MRKIYKQLSIEERTMIQTQLEMKITPAAIAFGLNRSASTISRELLRNDWVRPKALRSPGRPPVAGGVSFRNSTETGTYLHCHTAC